MSRKLFGTDGIRGKANTYPMTGEVMMALGRAVTSYFQQNQEGDRPTIIIGKDTRLSCYMLEQAFASGVCSQGGQAFLTGPLPTPGVAFVTKSMRANAGVMISASHNPFWDNGIKIFNAEGRKISDEVEKILEDCILNDNSMSPKVNEHLGSTKRLDDVIGRYIVHVKSTFSEHYSLEGMRIVVDCANGAAYKIAPMIFSELGAEVISLGDSPNGRNINDQVGSMYPRACQDAVVKYRADLGICLDGDADRLVLIDNDGDVVPGDQLIGLCAKFLLKKGLIPAGGEVVGTVMTNLGLESYLKTLGLSLARTKVGDRYLLEYMEKSHASFGGEPSGHLIFRNYSTTGDGILAALKVLEVLLTFKRPLKELLKPIKLFPQIIENVRIQSKKSLEEIDDVQNILRDITKKEGDRCRTVLRYSGTEPLVRVMIEGESSVDIGGWASKLSSVLEKHLGV